MYLSTDYFGTRLIIFDNNMNTIGNHFLYQVRGQISCIYLPSDLVQKIISYSIHVIVEYNQAGSEIICRQICTTLALQIRGVFPGPLSFEFGLTFFWGR